jgi:hypothetical protein
MQYCSQLHYNSAGQQTVRRFARLLIGSSLADYIKHVVVIGLRSAQHVNQCYSRQLLEEKDPVDGFPQIILESSLGRGRTASSVFNNHHKITS